jgi:hypothetical protein
LEIDDIGIKIALLMLGKDLHTHTTVKPEEGAGGALSLVLLPTMKLATKLHKGTQKEGK